MRKNKLKILITGSVDFIRFILIKSKYQGEI